VSLLVQCYSCSAFSRISFGSPRLFSAPSDLRISSGAFVLCFLSLFLFQDVLLGLAFILGFQPQLRSFSGPFFFRYTIFRPLPSLRGTSGFAYANSEFCPSHLAYLPRNSRFCPFAYSGPRSDLYSGLYLYYKSGAPSESFAATSYALGSVSKAIPSPGSQLRK
jgi:hypothetical protein